MPRRPPRRSSWLCPRPHLLHSLKSCPPCPLLSSPPLRRPPFWLTTPPLSLSGLSFRVHRPKNRRLSPSLRRRYRTRAWPFAGFRLRIRPRRSRQTLLPHRPGSAKVRASQAYPSPVSRFGILHIRETRLLQPRGPFPILHHLCRIQPPGRGIRPMGSHLSAQLTRFFTNRHPPPHSRHGLLSSRPRPLHPRPPQHVLPDRSPIHPPGVRAGRRILSISSERSVQGSTPLSGSSASGEIIGLPWMCRTSRTYKISYMCCYDTSSTRWLKGNGPPVSQQRLRAPCRSCQVTISPFWRG